MNHDVQTATEILFDTGPRDEEPTTDGSLSAAAEHAIKEGVDLQDFMTAAYGAYLAANPELRHQLESQHLLAQMDELRRRGRLGQA